MPRLRLGKLAEEALCLGRPSTASLTGQHDKPGSPVATSQLKIHQLFPSARNRAAPSTTWLRGCGVPPRSSGETRVVSRASCAPWNNGNPSATTSRRRASTRPCGTRSKIPHHHVRREPFSCLATDTSCTAFQSECSATQHPRLSASCPVVAKRVLKTATPTEARRGEKGLQDTSQEEDAKL